ncbi:hypothetical protein BC941DRAFT_440254 [Chlamydoabsidia padenii]|nr:hypothetical protein BC941DRAFT_440254 [Chlamydoabsidia padenii]
MRDAMERIRRHRQRIVEERRIQEEDNLHLVEMSYNRMLPKDQTTIFITTTHRDRYLADVIRFRRVQSQHPPHWLKNYVPIVFEYYILRSISDDSSTYLPFN